MNKIRLFGILLLGLSLALAHYIDNDSSGWHFLYGALAGMGGVLAISGKLRWWR